MIRTGGLMSDDVLIPLILIVSPVLFAAFWLTITSILGKMSGWNDLERIFPDRPETPLDTVRFVSARMRAVSYNNCLRFDMCPTGLRISVFRLIGPFQKPLFVPWGQIKPETQRAFFVKHVALVIGYMGEGSLAISSGAFARIVANSPLRAA